MKSGSCSQISSSWKWRIGDFNSVRINYLLTLFRLGFILLHVTAVMIWAPKLHRIVLNHYNQRLGITWLTQWRNVTSLRRHIVEFIGRIILYTAMEILLEHPTLKTMATFYTNRIENMNNRPHGFFFFSFWDGLVSKNPSTPLFSCSPNIPRGLSRR